MDHTAKAHQRWAQQETAGTSSTERMRMHLVSHEDSLEADVDVRLEPVAQDVELVLVNERPIGWIHHVDPVYVALVGGTLAHAVEVSQKHTLDGCLHALVDTVPVDALVKH